MTALKTMVVAPVLTERPELHPAHHEALYDYFLGIETDPQAVELINKVSSRIYAPIVHFAGGALEEITERSQADESIIWTSNHLTMFDQFASFAAMNQIEGLDELAKRIFMLAKSKPYFDWEHLGHLFTTAGWLPVLRRKEFPNIPKQVAEASHSLLKVTTAKAVDGQVPFLFPQGTRKKENLTEVGTIGGGVARIAIAASEESEVAIVPTAIWWGEGLFRTRRSPHYFIGNPINGPFNNKPKTTKTLRAAMQTCLDQVVEHSDDKS